MASTNSGSVFTISSADALEYSLTTSAISPDTMAASELARHFNII